MFKSTRQTKMYEIPLRPVGCGGDRRRLGLYTAEFREYVQGKVVKKLSIDLGDGAMNNILSLKTYAHGSITNPLINDWLQLHGWTSASDRLLFKLEIDEKHYTHTYRFVKHL